MPAAETELENDALCAQCGRLGNLDPMLHFERHGHWPTLPADQYGTAAGDAGRPPVASLDEMLGHGLLLLEGG